MVACRVNSASVRAIGVDTNDIRPTTVVPNWATAHSTDCIVVVEHLPAGGRPHLVGAEPLLQRLVTGIALDDGRLVLGIRGRDAVPTHRVAHRAVELDGTVIVALIPVARPATDAVEPLGCARTVGRHCSVSTRVDAHLCLPAAGAAAAVHTVPGRCDRVLADHDSGAAATRESDEHLGARGIRSGVGTLSCIRSENDFGASAFAVTWYRKLGHTAEITAGLELEGRRRPRRRALRPSYRSSP